MKSWSFSVQGQEKMNLNVPAQEEIGNSPFLCSFGFLVSPGIV
jgi:hypothetical protein